MAKRALVIAYYFPPLGLGGVQRMSKLAKYLPGCGYEVTVLTVKHISYPAYDAALLDELPPQVTIARAGSRDPARIAGVLGLPVKPSPKAAALAKNRGGLWPDSKIGWKHAAVRLGAKLLKEKHHDVIISSSPPMTAHLVARELHRRFDIPWVADFRDIWESRAPEEVYRKRRLVERSYALLKEIGETASAITSINATIGDRLAADNVVIAGGFDEDDMPPEQLPDAGPAYFELCYLGSVGPLHPIEPFFEAARLALSKNTKLAAALRIHIIGANDVETLRNKADACGLAERLVITPYRTHRESLRLAATAAATLLSVPAGYDDILTGKIFDYLGLPQPTLASVPENGEAWRLLHRHAGGVCVPPGDADALAGAMLCLYDDYLAGRVRPKRDLAAVTRRAAAQQFAAVFDGVTGDG